MVATLFDDEIKGAVALHEPGVLVVVFEVLPEVDHF